MANRVSLLLGILLPLVSCGQPSVADTDLISAVLDEFHDAAANGDKTRYLNQMTDDAVFMGTDETERWPKHPDFTDYVDMRFVDGRGWTYHSVDRNVQISDGGDVAWFDEVVFSETNGRFRGTGILVRDADQWRIAHYAFSFLIDNEHWEAVIALTREGEGTD